MGIKIGIFICNIRKKSKPTEVKNFITIDSNNFITSNSLQFKTR